MKKISAKHHKPHPHREVDVIHWDWNLAMEVINKEIDPNHSQLMSFLRQYWSKAVVKAYPPPENCMNVHYDEKEIDELLLSPLTSLLTGSPGMSLKDFADSLGVANVRANQICGKVFKNGEATYSCRECATDPTCVLCFDCFSNSPHKSHKYRMATSGGSGYCDCGDEEAWKSHPVCDRHSRTDEGDSALPVDVERRLRALLHCVLHHMVEMICWNLCDVLPQGIDHQDLIGPFQTMLFNDESHSYDEVIRALTKALNCAETEAIYFATIVDREGRSSVKCGSRETCDKAKAIIQQKTSKNKKQPLNVEVMDSNVVSHQIFSLRLVQWCIEAVQQLPVLLPIVNEIFTEPRVDGELGSLMQIVMEQDSKLFKGARSAFHNFIMATVLMENERKKIFASQFTKLYPSLMQEFIEDDHEHSLSVVALTVQIFTVPTIARFLIAEHKVLEILFSALITNMEPFKQKSGSGKLSFERNQIPINFKRSLCIIHDIKYILTTSPTASDWTDDLRANFCGGFEKLLDFLQMIQGMDSVVRQTAQHQEFEPEWETAFNILIRCVPVLCLIQKWCATDVAVQQYAYRAALTRLRNTQSPCRTRTFEVANHPGDCVLHDVSTQAVSVHLPLHRLFAGICANIDRFNLLYKNPEYQVEAAPLIEILIELPLRIMVMVAQCNAGMWRRNGYSLLNQVHNYFSPLCRTEMFDKDVLILQVGAALMDPNEFMIKVAHKFGLYNWLHEDYDNRRPEDEISHHIVTLGEEFLQLFVVIIAERYTPGVGKTRREDLVKREVIHLLCKGPSTFSELEKRLSEDPNEKTGLESVIRDVATFRKPTSGGAGYFELAEGLRSQWSPFFYHYSKSDRSKAEMFQTKLNRDELTAPVTPPEYCDTFKGAIFLLNCDVMLQMFTVVIKRCLSKSFVYSDSQLHRVLYLIGYALNEELRSKNHVATDEDSKPFVFSTKAAYWHGSSLLELLQSIVGLPHTEQFSKLIQWTINRFNEALAHQQPAGHMAVMESSVVLIENSDVQINSADEKQKKRLIAEQRRKKAMQQMSALQKSFVKKHIDELELTSAVMEVDGQEVDFSQASCGKLSACVGADCGPVIHLSKQRVTCVLCQESQEIGFKGRAVVLAAFVQNSTLFSKSRTKVIRSRERDKFSPLFMPADLFLAPHLSTCGHTMHWECWTSFFEAVVIKEQRRAPLRMRVTLVDVDRNEYLCPLCKRISNTVLPMFPPLRNCENPEAPLLAKHLNYDEWLEQQEQLLAATEKRSSAVADVKSSEGVGGHTDPSEEDVVMEEVQVDSEPEDGEEMPEDLAVLDPVEQEALQNSVVTLEGIISHLFGHGHRVKSKKQPEMSSPKMQDGCPVSLSNFEMMKTLSQAIYTNYLRSHTNPNDARVPVTSWVATAYTIRCLEGSLKCEGKPLFGAFTSRQKDALYPLVRYAGLCNLVSPASVSKTHSLMLIGALLDKDDQLHKYPAVLNLDAFTIMVELCMSFGWLNVSKETQWSIPTGGESEHHILELLLSVYMLQLILSADESDEAPVEESEVNSKDCEIMRELHSWIWSCLGLTSPKLSGGTLLKQFKVGLLTFLRQAAIFFHCITLVPPPEALKDPNLEQLTVLCRYLALPHEISELLNLIRRPIAQRWLSHPLFQANIKAGHFVRQPVEVNKLVALPHDFSELINKAAHFSCPSLNLDDSRTPTMCLICGEMLCSQGYCCQKNLGKKLVGACTYHSYFCNAETGLFLRIRDCQVIMLARRVKGCFDNAPYVDEYGEADQGFKRGNPLFLNPEGMKKLEHMWLHQTIHETIVSHLEYSLNLITIDWQNL